MAQGNSNDLNMLLKAKVVKLKVELDAKGSKLPQQVNNISKMLENKPVKLKVELSATIRDLNMQIGKITNMLKESSSFKPIKLDVQIDVQGSAQNIKNQLKEINEVVSNFNKQYSRQIKEIQDAQEKVSKQSGLNVPTNASVQGFNNIKDYVNQLKEAERILRSKFSDGQGLFSSVQIKDVQGNLLGFIASLERANGVIEKVRYNWNKDKNKFEIVDRTTATAIEKMVHRSKQALADLQRELKKTGDASRELTLEYQELQRAGEEGTLTMDAVKAFQTKVRNAQEEARAQKQLNDLKREELKLIRDITNATKGTGTQFTNETKDLIKRTKSASSMDEYKDIRVDLSKLTDEVKKYRDAQKEAEVVTRQKQKALMELTRLMRETHETEGALSRDNIKAVQEMAKRAQTMKQMASVQQQLNAMYKQEQSIKYQDAREKALNKLKDTMIELARVTGTEINTIEARFNQLQRNIGGNIAQINAQIATYEKKIRSIADKSAIDNLQRQAESVLEQKNGFTHTEFRKLINDGDITAIKDYLARWEELNIATAKVSTNAKGVTRITATLESTGKTAKQVTYEIDTLTNKLKKLGTQDVFNRNANLGVFEQLRIAMARVPVWMASMTAFYGTIHSVEAMSDQILQLDKALTELRRVASANINIDTVFKGAVELSKELGNNIFDIMGSVNELARTFGDFNERQLLAITKTATLMSNVSDLTAQEATETLVGTMNAFNITAEDSIHIVDALNEVDNNYAISTKQLAEGLEKSSSTAKTFGVTLEENIGNITAIGAVTMESGSIIGNALKTIYSRITTVKEAKEALEGVGVAIQDQAGDARNVEDILSDLAGKWGTLSKQQQQHIAVVVAGRYQLSRFLALMNNWQMAQEATTTAITSQGSAMRENQRYMQSFEARINQLKNGFTELATSVGDAVLSSSMLEIIRLLTNMAQVAVTVTKTFGVLPVAFGAVAAVMMKMGVLDKVTKGIEKGLEAMRVAFVEASVSSTGFGGAVTRASAAASTGFTMLGARATAAMTTVKTSMKAALMSVITFGEGFRAVLASTAVGALFVGIGFAIEKLINLYEQKKRKEEELIKLNKKMVDSYRQHSDGMQSLIQRYEELSKKRRNNQEDLEYLKIQKQLATEIPTTVAYVDANGKAHMKSTQEIKREIEAVKELSKAQAQLAQAKFNEEMEKRAKSYQKIIDKVEELKTKQEKLEKNNGRNFMYATIVDNTEGFKINNDKAIQQTKVEIMMAEAEKTEAIQKTIKAIQKQTLAYYEAEGKLSTLGDDQQAVIEKFISYNESMLRYADTPKKFEKAYRDLFNIGTKVGDVFSEAYLRMSKGMENDPLKLEDLKKDLGYVAKAIPESFFQLTDEFGRPKKSIEEVQAGLKEIINVSNRVAQGDGNWDGLVKRLKEAGLSSKEAKGFLANLAREHDNAKLRAKAQAEGVDELTNSIDDLNKKTIDALDLTKSLFGYSGQDLSAMKSHLQNMMLIVDTMGEAGKKTDSYKESQEALAEFLGITTSELENNKDKYFEIIDALTKLDLSTYDTNDSFESFIKNNKDLTQAQKNLLLEWSKTDGAKDVITGANKEIMKSNDDLQESADKTKKKIDDVFKKPKENGVKDSIKETKKEAEDTSWIDKFKSKLSSITGIGDGKTKGGLGNWLIRFIPPSMQKDMKTAGQTIEKFFSGLPSKASTGLKTFGKSVDDFFGGYPSKIGKGLSGWGKAISDWFDGLPSKSNKGMESWGQSVSKWFQTLPDRVSPHLENLYVSIRDWIRSAPSRFKQEMSSWGDSITQWFTEKKEGISQDIEQWWQPISSWFSSLPSRTGTAFSNWWTSITQWFSNTKTSWANNLDQWWSTISQWFTNTTTLWGTNLNNWWTSISQWFTNTTSLWGTNLSQWGQSIGQWFSNLPVTQWLQNFWTSIATWFSNTKGNWSSVLGQWWTGVTDWFNSVGEKMEVAKTAGGKIVDKIREGLSSKGGSILSKIGEIVSNIPNYIFSDPSSLLTTGRGIIQRIITGVTQGVPSWGKKWDEIKEKAKKKLAELATDGFSKGKSILGNVTNGIQAKVKEWLGKWDDIKATTKKKVEKMRDDIVSVAKSIPKRMGDAITGQAKQAESGVKSLANKISSALEKGLNNTVVKGVNSVLDYMGVEKYHLKKFKFPRYAQGTKNGTHPGGLAIVGEKGRELAYIPNHGVVMLGEKGSEIVNLPKGTSVLPNKHTERLLKSYGFPAYEDGIGDYFVKFMDSPKKLMEKVFGLFKFKNPLTGMAREITEKGIDKAKDGAVDYVADKMKDFFSSVVNGASGQLTKWLTVAIKLTGVPMTWLQPLIAMAKHESGGNPRAINLWDSNYRAGHPSKGLLQTIDSTFNAYKLPGLDDIWNPIHNAVAAIRYILDRYGSIFNTPSIKGLAKGKYKGYANGGIIDKMELAWHGEEGAEAIIPLIAKRRKRGLQLWREAGIRLGVDPQLLEWIKPLSRRSSGGIAYGDGGSSFSASSGEGSTGGEGGGGDSGTSGIIRPSIYAGGIGLDGTYEFHALATAKPNPYADRAELYTYNIYERTAQGYEININELEAKIQGLDKASEKYRNTLKSIITYENLHLAVIKKDLAATEKRNAQINARLKQLSNTSKHTKAQREEYNKLQQEYEQNLSKIGSLRQEIQSSINEIHDKSVEMFTDFIDEISSKYDDVIKTINDKLDDINFSIDVANIVDPDNTQNMLNLLIQKAQEAQKLQSTAFNKINSLEAQYNKIVLSKGVNSDEANYVKEQLDKAKEEYEDYTMAVLNAEKDIKDTRAKIADEAIQKLQDYYKNMKDMALNAIDAEKDALQKAHDDKMKMYDDEINKINAIYDAREKALDQQKQEDDYQEQLNEKNQQRADLVNKISILSRNGTLDDKKKVADLKQQLADLDKEIADFQKQHQMDLLKQQLEDQRNAEIQRYNGGYDEYGNYIKGLKELEDEQLQDRLDALDKEKDAISKHYDDLINDEQRWAEIRNQAIKGNFNTLQIELTKMTDNLNQMNQGIFDNLTTSFATFADEVKQKIAELNKMAIDNMLYDAGGVVDAVNGASNSNNYTMTNGANQDNGTKIPTPNITTPPKTTTKTPTTSKPSTTSPTSTGTQYYTVQKGDTFWDIENKLGLAHGTLAKLNPTVNPNKLQVGQKLIVKKGTTSSSSSSRSASSSSDRKVTTALNMRSTPAYGNNVITTIPKNAKVEYLGMVDGWAKIKYNGKIGYVGSQYLAKFDTGGYTGDDIPKEGALGILHRKELVLNENQTSDILDTVKIMDKMTSVLPDIKRSNFVQRIAEGIGNTNIANHYEINVNVDRVGSREDANTVANVIVKELRKRGR